MVLANFIKLPILTQELIVAHTTFEKVSNNLTKFIENYKL